MSLAVTQDCFCCLKCCDTLINRRARTNAVALRDDGPEASDLERRTRDGGCGQDDPVYPNVVRVLEEFRNVALVLLRVILHREQVSVPTLTCNINRQQF